MEQRVSSTDSARGTGHSNQKDFLAGGNERARKKRQCGNPILRADGQPVRASVIQRVQKEGLVSLYDISQTKGEAFPPSIQNVHAYHVKDYEEIAKALQEVHRNLRDDMGLGEKERIQVNSNLPPRLAVFVALRRLAQLEALQHRVGAAHTTPAAMMSTVITFNKEMVTIASEAAAYIACKHLGVEVIDFVAPTLAETCGEQALELSTGFDVIRGCALDLMGQIDTKLAEIRQEKGLSNGREMLQRQGNAPEQTKVSIKEQLAAAQAEVDQRENHLSPDSSQPEKGSAVKESISHAPKDEPAR